MSQQQLTADELAVVQALVRDVTATVGLRDQAVFTNWLITEALDARSRRSVRRDLSAFRDDLVDDFQQRMHDEFIDVSWPRCLLHPNHPMWLQDGAWRCTKDDVLIARLGQLPSEARRDQ